MLPACRSLSRIRSREHICSPWFEKQLNSLLDGMFRTVAAQPHQHHHHPHHAPPPPRQYARHLRTPIELPSPPKPGDPPAALKPAESKGEEKKRAGGGRGRKRKRDEAEEGSGSGSGEQKAAAPASESKAESKGESKTAARRRGSAASSASSSAAASASSSADGSSGSGSGSSSGDAPLVTAAQRYTNEFDRAWPSAVLQHVKAYSVVLLVQGGTRRSRCARRSSRGYSAPQTSSSTN